MHILVNKEMRQETYITTYEFAVKEADRHNIEKFDVGETYHLNEVKLHYKGFHFYKIPVDLLQYANKNSVFYEISVLSTEKDYENISITNSIKVNKIVPYKEVILRTNGSFYNELGIFHYKNGKLHRNDDLPAIIWSDGTREWYIDGKHRRNNGKPVVIFTDDSSIKTIEDEEDVDFGIDLIEEASELRISLKNVPSFKVSETRSPCCVTDSFLLN